MNYIKNIILPFIWIISFGYINGQQSQINNSLPSVIPPSPDAAALGKYGQYPVNMNNGLVNINIPIYTIKIPKLEIPISLSYHPSGIKVDEVASWVGLGWVLNAGGVITRSVRSLPDDNFGKQGVLHDKNFVNNLSSGEMIYEYLQIQSTNEEKGVFDNESDVYYYNVNGMSGSFRYDVNGNIVQIPLSNNKIEFDAGLNKFMITSTDGTQYVFSDIEKTRLGGRNGDNAPWTLFTSSWYLSYIITTDKNEVDFNYLTDNTVYEEDYENIQIKECNSSFCSGEYCSTEQPVEIRTYTAVAVEQTKVLSSITFPGGSISFNTVADRIDKRNYRLSSIGVGNGSGSWIKEVNFHHSYFTSTPLNNYDSHANYRLKLDYITFTSNEKYSFDYNTTQLLPQYYSLSHLPVSSSYYGHDYWGYYNGISTNKSLLTCYPYGYVSENIANREINATYAQACILKRITYPTGGYTDFGYEGNTGENGEKTGGLRIKTITSYDQVNSTSLVKTYNYDQAQNSFWSINDISGKKFTRGINFFTGEYQSLAQLGYNYYLSQPALPLSFTSGASALYQKVTEFEGDENTNNGRTDYYFEYAFKDVEWYVADYIYPSYFIPKFESYPVDRGWKRGDPTITEYYTNNNGIYNLVKKVENEYTIFNFQNVKVGFFSFSNCYPLIGRWEPGQLSKADAKSYFQYNDIPVETGLKKLTKTTTYDYTETGTVTDIINYAYDHLDKQYQVSSVTATLSNGSTSKTEYTYSNDLYTTSPYNIHQFMVDRNMLSQVIQQDNYVDGQFLKSVHTTYHGWDNDLIAPLTVETKTGTLDPTVRLRYYGYDSRGNVLGVSREKDIKLSYVWGYDQTLPVVKGENIENATLNSIVASAMATAGISKFEDITNPFSDATQKAKWKTFNTALKNSLTSNVSFTTYTYRPLIGITSQTDSNGASTYYLYDSSNRLEKIIDNAGNIIKSYKYHYKEQ